MNLLNLLKKSAALIVLLSLTNCASNNIKSYRVDPNLKFDVQQNELQKIFIKSVTMPKDDTNNIMCRMAGNIYLPKKMTYSQYIKDAFITSVRSIDKLSESENGAHRLSVVLTQVNFCTISGEWYIDGDVTVDHYAPVQIKTVTEYGTSYDAMSACRNTAEAFDEAVMNFVKKILTNSQIVANLKKTI